MINKRKGIGRQSAIIDTELLQVFPYFIQQSRKSTEQYSKIVPKDFRILTVLKLLSCIQYYDMTFSELLRSSNIIMKKSYINYVSMCKHFGLITNTKIGHSSIFSITKKGKIMLGLFKP